jgi:hypothetical protein
MCVCVCVCVRARARVGICVFVARECVKTLFGNKYFSSAILSNVSFHFINLLSFHVSDIRQKKNVSHNTIIYTIYLLLKRLEYSIYVVKYFTQAFLLQNK